MFDYQVGQTNHGITVDLITTGTVDTDDLTAELTSAPSAAGLIDPTVDVHVVPALTRDDRTGKLAQFVPAPARYHGASAV